MSLVFQLNLYEKSCFVFNHVLYSGMDLSTVMLVSWYYLTGVFDV